MGWTWLTSVWDRGTRGSREGRYGRHAVRWSQVQRGSQELQGRHPNLAQGPYRSGLQRRRTSEAPSCLRPRWPAQAPASRQRPVPGLSRARPVRRAGPAHWLLSDCIFSCRRGPSPAHTRPIFPGAMGLPISPSAFGVALAILSHRLSSPLAASAADSSRLGYRSISILAMSLNVQGATRLHHACERLHTTAEGLSRRGREPRPKDKEFNSLVPASAPPAGRRPDSDK